MLSIWVDSNVAFPRFSWPKGAFVVSDIQIYIEECIGASIIKNVTWHQQADVKPRSAEWVSERPVLMVFRAKPYYGVIMRPKTFHLFQEYVWACNARTHRNGVITRWTTPEREKKRLGSQVDRQIDIQSLARDNSTRVVSDEAYYILWLSICGE